MHIHKTYNKFQDQHPNKPSPLSQEEFKILIHQCHICQKVLGSREALYTHLKLTHKVRQEKSVEDYSVITDQKCDHCEKIMKTDIEYVDHLVNEHPASKLPTFVYKQRKIFKCRDCSYQCSKLKNYYKHRGGLVEWKLHDVTNLKRRHPDRPILCPKKQ